jgi:hypothetical protein
LRRHSAVSISANDGKPPSGIGVPRS